MADTHTPSPGVASRVDKIESKIERIDRTLTGNGDPEKGLLMRVIMLEQTIKVMAETLGEFKQDVQKFKRAAWLAAGAAGTGTGVVGYGVYFGPPPMRHTQPTQDVAPAAPPKDHAP